MLLKLVRAHVFVSGLVQGVFFRANTIEKAHELGVNGWIRNVDDRVEAVFEGNEDRVKKIIEWCKKGPINARIDKIETRFYEYSGEFNSFEMR